MAINDVIRESMFGNLEVINEFEAFTRNREESLTASMKELLCDVQCPVLVVPNNFKTVDKIVLLYDGRPSSLYVVKTFSYLFACFWRFRLRW